MSVDTVAAQRAFAIKCDVRFPLLADTSGNVSGLYGVLGGAYAARVSFVLDAEGLVRYIDENIRVTRHGPDMLKRVRRMRE